MTCTFEWNLRRIFALDQPGKYTVQASFCWERVLAGYNPTRSRCPQPGAFVEVTAESGGATPRNGQQHFDMLPADPPSASFDEGVSRSADEIGNFEDGPVHLLVLQHPLVEIGRWVTRISL